MNLLQLSWKNILHKPTSTLLSLVLFALGVGLVSLLMLVNRQLEDKFEKNLAGIDMVIGAKGSPLQLILSSMYHIDAPTGNVAIADVKAFLNPKHPVIGKAVPLSLGDNYRSYRIVGTTFDFFDLYKAELAQGRRWEAVFEVVIGAAVADALDLKTGDTFHSSHGFVVDENLEHTDASAFKVVGVLQPTGAVVDQLILTSPQSIWGVHEHGDHEHEHEAYDLSKPLTDYEGESITSVLVQFKARNAATLNMPRGINENTNMQAATPAWEINRLYAILGDSALALQVLALIIIAVSGLSVFLSLYASLRDRRYELALMRVMGASRGKLFALILLEGLLLAAVGCVIGLALSHTGMGVFARALESSYRYSFTGALFLKEEIWLVLAALGVGLLAAFIPAVQARNTDISQTLAEG
ncbi:MAG: ABC transporter permease [Saprospiraceae bacterium]|jgi:putative ABC transport system permease protein|nr:ABC transporter permease [Saprospiraceae bacterium]